MTYYELLQENPTMAISLIVISAAITARAYCAVPLIFALIRKNPILKKKYRWICWISNFFVMVFFITINGKSSGVPYFLWTSIFTACGVKALRNRGVLMESDSEKDVEQSDIPQKPTSEIENAYIEPETDKMESYDCKYQINRASIEPRIDKNKKQRYCKMCGGEIDSFTKKCTKCGKQYFHLRIRRNSILAISAVVVLIVLIVLNIYQYIQYNANISTMSNEVESLQNEVSELTFTVEDLDTQLSEVTSRLSESIMNNKKLNLENIMLRGENRTLNAYVDFCDKYVVFVSDNGTGLYHRYGCSEFDSSSFWAYNIEAAKGNGYTPCPKCHK